MTSDQLLRQFKAIIAEKIYHPHYARTVEIAEFAYRVMTGRDQDELVTSVRRRETAAEEDQRIRLTNTLTPIAGRMVQRMFDKMRRVEPAERAIRYLDADEEAEALRIAAIEKRLVKFYAGQSLDEYLFDKLTYFTFFDPNAFLLIERRNIYDDTGALLDIEVYPVEIPSQQVRYFLYEHGVLKALLVERTEREETDSQVALSRFLLYGPTFTIEAVEYEEAERVDILQARINGQARNYDRMVIEGEDETRHFQYFVYTTGAQEIPAMRFSSYLDGVTGERTGVTPLEPAHFLLRDLINLKSLSDLTTYLHTFPRRWAYTTACDYSYEGETCDMGYLMGTDGQVHSCPQCGGTGDKYHRSEQDVIRIAIPPGVDNVLDLSKFSHVEPVNLDLKREQREELNDILKLIMVAVFNQEVFSMAQVQRTATEAMLDYQNIYDTLQVFGEKYSLLFEKTVRVTAEYLDIFEGLVVDYAFPKDLQYETETDLIQRYSAAKSAGVSRAVLDSIDLQLLQRQTKNKEDIQRARAWLKWKPWRDLPDALLAQVLAARAPKDAQRVLFENWDDIQRSVEQDSGGRFFTWEYDQQENIISDYIRRFREKIEYSIPEPLDIDMTIGD